MPTSRRVTLSKSEPREPELTDPRDLPFSDEPISDLVTLPTHRYNISLSSRLRIAVSILLRGALGRAFAVAVGASSPTITEAERSNMLEGFKSWKTTFLGILTGVSTLIAALLGKGIGEGLVEMIATILAVITSIVLIFIRPKDKEEPSPNLPE